MDSCACGRFAISDFLISSDFNTTSKTGGWKQPPIGGQAKPESDNATGFNRWFFTSIPVVIVLHFVFLNFLNERSLWP